MIIQKEAMEVLVIMEGFKVNIVDLVKEFTRMGQGIQNINLLKILSIIDKNILGTKLFQ